MSLQEGLITQDNTGAEFYANIFAIAESEIEDGVIWVGSDDGLIHVTKNGGKTWKNVAEHHKRYRQNLNMINSIDISSFNKGKAYVAATAYKFGDYTPYLYKTDDYGETWTLITKGINKNYYTRVIRADKKRPGLLYSGTEWGMFISFDDGSSWKSFQLNLPITAIRDLHVKENDLIVATHGRSFWIIDDLTPLHQLSKKLNFKNSHLYKPDISYRMQSGGKPNTLLTGENHPNGVIINYFIKNIKNDDFVKIEIFDQKEKLIRSYTNNKDKLLSSSVKPVSSNSNDIDYALSGNNIKSLDPNSGGNRLIWDMRYPGYKTFEGMVFYSSPNVGPKAVPGKYNLRLTYNQEVTDQEFNIIKDPRLINTKEDFRKQFDFLLSVRNEVSRANQAIIDIRDLRKDLGYVIDKSNKDEDINSLIDEFLDELHLIENSIHMTKNQSRQDPLNYGIRINNRLAFLMADSQRGDYPPTDQSLEFFIKVKKELEVELNNLSEVSKKYIELYIGE